MQLGLKIICHNIQQDTSLRTQLLKQNQESCRQHLGISWITLETLKQRISSDQGLWIKRLTDKPIDQCNKSRNQPTALWSINHVPKASIQPNDLLTDKLNKQQGIPLETFRVFLTFQSLWFVPVYEKVKQAKATNHTCILTE